MKKKLLPLAMLAGLAGAAGTAQAVHVNSDGLGEALIYPFYTVEEGQNTYVTVVNTTEEYKAVKVRFIEAENSAEVLDFNLYLSPEDVWTGAIVPDGDGTKLITRDNSCTAPYIQRPDEDGEGTDGVSFVDYEFDGDGGTQTIDRTREGYIEIIEMGVITDGDIQDEIQHDSSGMPGDCDSMRARWLDSGRVSTGGFEEETTGTGEWLADAQDGFAQYADLDEGGSTSTLGGLYGYGVIINPAGGTNASYSAVALDEVFGAEAQPLVDGGSASYTSQHADPGTVDPSFGDAYELAVVIDGSDATQYVTYDGWDAVSAVFMHETVSNDFMLDSFVNGDTDWVISMPTKRVYVNNVVDAATGDDGATPWDDTLPRPPFTSEWDGNACEYVDLSAWDREEAITTLTGDLDFSPRPPADDSSEEFEICKEVNVLSFGEGTALYPSERIQYGVPDLGYENGWARLSFASDSDGDPRYLAVDPNPGTPGDSEYLRGLPVTGFSVQKFVNGALDGGLLANYAGLIHHAYTRVADLSDPADETTDVEPAASVNYDFEI
ncbi:hypothetical protein KO507_17610 [Gilvimarinus agarilyticus]|uniref:hypothetical protein n=1 Tax=Gilvimarinus sp. 2_MG-2023 TaxID=3062666 RepID=UPI001C08BDBE|nr:hypothetical protein [Gilvimarinus sp. 2_MG-2023]MBU2887586.1 hypothetical protein [Gilvimarinus agarilyticus]MDO6572237.1 hypothetical protein [Gilvimarinus sp. 2_MG-2023]